jgi:MFS transporter, DHA2 family, multidrug resistance protein
MDHLAPYPPPAKRRLIMLVVMAATIMQLIDTTIANVALPHMRASLGATQDQISWVLTSYAVATAIAIPTTGFIESRIGRRNLFLVSLAGFIASSALCGISGSIEMIVGARILQGLFGAFITPLGQAIIYDSFPDEDRPRTMAIWAMGAMVAPIVGPLLGGWLTDHWSWRWVYFINIPIGIPTFLFAAAILDRGNAAARKLDWRGYLLIAAGLTALQLLLDRGTTLDWFDSTEICIELGLCVAALWMFGVHSYFSPAPLIPREVWLDRNVLAAAMITFVNSGSMIMSATLVSLMVQGMMGYDTIDAGLVSLPRGIAMAFTMMLAGKLVTLVDVRLIIASGLLIISGGFWIMTGFAPGMDASLIMMAAALQGIGFGFVMLPVNLMSFATIAPQLRTESAALMALFRYLGMSVMLSVATAIIARGVQVSHSEQAAHISNETMPMLNAGLMEQLGFRGQALYGMLDIEINRQAIMIAYDNVFWLMTFVTLFVLPTLLLVRWAGSKPTDAEPAMMEAH